MKAAVELRFAVSEAQADRLHERLSMLPFKVAYQEEQHGASLVVVLGYNHMQEKPIREVLNDLGVSVSDNEEDLP